MIDNGIPRINNSIEGLHNYFNSMSCTIDPSALKERTFKTGF